MSIVIGTATIWQPSELLVEERNLLSSANQSFSVSMCEGCLVVRSGHGPQAEVAQGVGPEPLVEH